MRATELIGRGAIALLIGLCDSPARAQDMVVITDASQLSYQLFPPDGHVYFRNLNTFNGAFLGCCYNYYIDLNTVTGRAIMATILERAALAKPIYFQVSNAAAGGALLTVGVN